MRVHHLNCISTCPLGGKLMDEGPESLVERGHLTNHCLLVEDRDSLILIDTGLGVQDVLYPHDRLSGFFLGLLKPDFRIEMTALEQIKKLGFRPEDVRHIVLTHLDFDHAGGLDDFPHAKVHLLSSEKESAILQRSWLDRQRYRPKQWSTQKNWITYEAGEGENWFGLNKVYQLQGVSTDIALIPLIGHTLGHAGVAVQSDSKWLFQTGDAYFFHAEMDLENPHCTPGLTFYQNMMEKDRHARIWNQSRLRKLKRTKSEEIEIFCSHDLCEFERLAGHSARVPADRLHQHEHVLQP